MKNKASIFLFFFLGSFNCFSQKTDFSFFVGMEATKFVEIDINGIEQEAGDVEYASHRFNEISWLGGLEVDQKIYRGFGLSIESSLGRKYVRDITILGGFFSIHKIDYFHSYNSLRLKQELFSNFVAGGGVGNNLMLGIKNYKWFWEVRDEWVGILEFSYNHKRLNFDLSYIFGLENEHFLPKTKPSKSFQFKVGYKFKTLNWKWPRFLKKTKCPKL